MYCVQDKKVNLSFYWKTNSTFKIIFFFVEWKKTKTYFEVRCTSFSGYLNSWEFNQLLYLFPCLLQIRSTDAFASQATLTKR